MKKKLVITLSLLANIGLYAQTGINTPRPLAVFHVDGKGDNNLTGPLTPAQIANDVVVTAEGNLGIGTINPTNRLEIKSDTPGAIRIMDGSQSDGHIFITNDTGIGTWRHVAYNTKTVLGNFPNNNKTITSTSNLRTYSYSSINITLSKGKWLLLLGSAIQTLTNDRKWFHIKFSSSASNPDDYKGFIFLTVAKNQSSIADVLRNSISGITSEDKGMNLIAGSLPVEVTASKVTLYVFLENTGLNTWTMNTNYYTNYFYALPLN
ncbi:MULTISPECIES: hypothetical protein [Myroides]|uniref:hypothetical protein n=1 Tax=Myroides TaxID=76831 RepID=UPI000280A621|nr:MULTISPECIES: hypothetical protein [Myroides]EKB05729.1 hypothetical protein HMPREF9711_01108 [Myroides odoratimimus CCUG 3837]